MPIFIAIVVIIVASILSDGLGREGDAQLAIHEATLQAKRAEEQRSILARLEAKSDETVSVFVRDWHAAFPLPTSEQLLELLVIEAKIDNDVTSAARFTLAANQKKADSFNSTFSSPLGGKAVAKPGLY